MRTLTVTHRLGAYDICFESLEEALAALPLGSLFLSDENVLKHYGTRLPEGGTLVLPPGEPTKSMKWFEQCLEWLAKQGATRSTTLVAFGGGVIGDLGGFVASAYMRGIRFIQIPSTLLAQVDSAVGGKVGIDLASGKNLAGAFYPPNRVAVCLELLDSLSRRDFNNGMAEVWKYGFIADATFVGGLASGIAGSREGLEEMVLRCLEIKSEIVSKDELETTGLRAILNFGHTVGHAIEAVTGYTELLHGEAISIGMVLEAELGERLGITEKGTAQEVKECLNSQGLPIRLNPEWNTDSLVHAMFRDKKRKGSDLAFSLLIQMGQCKLVSNVSVCDVEQVLKEA